MDVNMQQPINFFFKIRNRKRYTTYNSRGQSPISMRLAPQLTKWSVILLAELGNKKMNQSKLLPRYLGFDGSHMPFCVFRTNFLLLRNDETAAQVVKSSVFFLFRFCSVSPFKGWAPLVGVVVQLVLMEEIVVEFQGQWLKTGFD